MRKFNKPFEGVPSGEIYPVAFQPGDQCPPELEAAAESLGVLGEIDEFDKGEQIGVEDAGDPPPPELEAAADETQQTEDKPAAAASESRRNRR